MSGQLQAHPNSQTDLEDDPLAELERIVAGDFDQVDTDTPTDQAEVPTAQEEAVLSDEVATPLEADPVETEAVSVEAEAIDEASLITAADVEEVSAVTIQAVAPEPIDEVASELVAEPVALSDDETQLADDEVSSEIIEPENAGQTDSSIDSMISEVDMEEEMVAELSLDTEYDEPAVAEQAASETMETAPGAMDAEISAQFESAFEDEVMQAAMPQLEQENLPETGLQDEAPSQETASEGTAGEAVAAKAADSSGFVWQEASPEEAQINAQAETGDTFDGDDMSFMQGLQEALDEAMELENGTAQGTSASAAEIEAVDRDLEDELMSAMQLETAVAEDQSLPDAEMALEAAAEALAVDEVLENGNGEHPAPAANELEVDGNVDFGSAFAQELGLDAITEGEGWNEEAAAAANADFARAAVPGASPVESEIAYSPQEQAVIGASLESPVTKQADADGLPAIESGGMDAGAMAGEQDGASGGRKYAVAALVVSLFAGSIIAGYAFLGDNTSASDGTPTIITADNKPFREKPDDPGGRVPANQDNASYERVDQSGSEEAQSTLVSNTEEPAALDEQKLVEIAPESTASTAAVEKDDGRLTPADSEPETPAQSVGGLAPRVVETVTVRRDGTLVETPRAPVAAITPALETPTQNVEVAGIQPIDTPVQDGTQQVFIPETQAGQPVAEAIPVAIQSIDGAKATGQIGVPEASPLPKPAPVRTAAVQPQAPKPAATPAATRSEWVVQVSSQTSPEAAQSSFDNISRRFSAVRGRPMSIQRATVNGGTFYRVRLQTQSRADANQLCSTLKAQGGSCFVTR